MNKKSSATDLDIETLNILQTLLHNINPYVSSFKATIELMMREDVTIVLLANKRPADEHF